MKTPEEIADEIVNVASDPPRTNGDGGCPSGHMDEDIDRVCSACLRSMIAAAISAERSAGLSDGGKDRKATPKLSAKPAPACARCGGSGYLCPVCSRSECFQGAPCPECRGKP